jgi:uncharacterized HAD superfamily protein/adenine/guanine phosphoribosyltransferase-like PRPP-binding protein
MFLDNLQYRNYDDLSRLVHDSDLNEFRDFNLIVGVPRSGMIPAYMIGLILNLPVIDIESYLSGVNPYVGSRMQKNWDDINKVLIVDDSIKFGGQIKKIREKVNHISTVEFKYLAIYATTDSQFQVHKHLEIIDHPRIFQWNLLHSWIFEYSCVDIDGVLCEDPTEDENDDAEQYLSFLQHVRPKYLPPCKIDVLVTSRLEKYRKQTEAWLLKMGVQYNTLEMLDLPDKATRVRLGQHAEFKANIYSRNKLAVLFIESNKVQAEKIFKITGKNVFCVENITMYAKEHSKPQSIYTKAWHYLKKAW